MISSASTENKSSLKAKKKKKKNLQCDKKIYKYLIYLLDQANFVHGPKNMSPKLKGHI